MPTSALPDHAIALRAEWSGTLDIRRLPLGKRASRLGGMVLDEISAALVRDPNTVSKRTDFRLKVS
jgi:hypothetical protein